MQHQAAKEKAAPSITNGPETWTPKTPPFVVVRHFARDDATDEQIRDLLQEHKIKSLVNLFYKYTLLGSVLKPQVGRDLPNAMNRALDRTVEKAMELLGGVLDYDRTCIGPPLLYYHKEATAVEPSGDQLTDRLQRQIPNFTLIYGPSGSGKTMFAINDIPEIILPGAILEKKSLRLHLTASDLLEDDEDSKDPLDLPALLVRYVEKKVFNLLYWPFGNVVKPPPMDLYLFVILDEAGSSTCKSYFDTVEKIEQLVSALKEMKGGYKFTKGVHVTLAGTWLETTTVGIDANLDGTIKFHMQPWSQSNFFALLSTMKPAGEETLKAVVLRYRILQNVITNARCAYFLAAVWPEKYNELTDVEVWETYINAVVAEIARCYIYSNILQGVRHGEERLQVVQEVFKALDKAMLQPNVACYPNFDSIESRYVRAATGCLFDIHLETVNRETKLMGSHTCSVSITPAIMIVLIQFLCENTVIPWNSREPEANVALGEWKLMVREKQASDFESKRSFVFVRYCIPLFDEETLSFFLPLVGKSTVLLNAPGAPYANVIAPFRLVRTKFSFDVNQPVELNFDKEMKEMGLLKTKAATVFDQVNQATASVLFAMWQRKFEVMRYERSVSRISQPSLYRSNDAEKESKEEVKRCAYYPFGQLDYKSSDYLPEQVSFTIDKEKGVVSHTDKEARWWNEGKPIKILQVFTRPVTAVFVTNAVSFLLEKKGNPEVMIGREDVDGFEGTIASLFR
jgi:hypothetical protein